MMALTKGRMATSARANLGSTATSGHGERLKILLSSAESASPWRRWFPEGLGGR